jgi:myo-inositol-1-phosphate synthase
MTVKVALAGVGNCVSSLVQGVEYYRDAADDEQVPGLMHVRLGGYHVSDLEFVAAFEVDADKVGKDLSEAIWAGPNNTIKFSDVPELGVTVQRGPTLDGLGEYYRDEVEESTAEPVDIVQALRDSGAEVLACYLPVGSEQAAKFYAQAALEAGVAFVNAIPVFIASDPEWAAKFVDAGLPIVGDDIKSQVGATITHRVLAHLMESRGIALDHTYQLNVGGNMDFKNMLERSRLKSKKISKTQAVTSNIEVDLPMSLEYKLEVWDSPNSAGTMIDAIRCAKVAKDLGHAGPVEAASAYFMKSPAVQKADHIAREELEEFLATA